MPTNTNPYEGQVNLPNDGQVLNINTGLLVPGDPKYVAPTNATMTNPNSRGVNDVSDIRPTSAVINLPIRGEKRLVPTTVDATLTNVQVVAEDYATQVQQTQDSDFFIYANSEAKRLQNAVDFIKIRIPHRGVKSSSLLADPTQVVEYRFLVNPATLTVNRQTVDSQSLTRGGWQFGVWGEDCFMVQMQGVSAGSYFSLGTTDEFCYYAVS